MSFSSATIAILVLGICVAFVAALLRTWGSAYLGISVVQSGGLHGDEVVAAGPYRWVRNPLYIGTFLHTLVLALLMPPSGAVFCIVAVGLFQLRLIGAEEAFLSARLGEPYLAYRARVPGLLPALRPRLAASDGAASVAFCDLWVRFICGAWWLRLRLLGGDITRSSSFRA